VVEIVIYGILVELHFDCSLDLLTDSFIISFDLLSPILPLLHFEPSV